jgi:HK97 family phage major capsid protein
MNMPLTKCLKSWLQEHANVPDTASDEEFTKAAQTAVTDGKLTADKLAELTDEKSPDEDPMDKLAEKIAAALSPAIAAQTEAIEKMATRQPETKEPDVDLSKLAEAVGDRINQAVEKAKPKEPAPATKMMADHVASQPRVKAPIEQYSATKTQACWANDHKDKSLRGMPASLNEGGMANFASRPKFFDHPSQADHAVCGAYFKWAAAATCDPRRIPRWLQMTDHEKDLVEYAMHELPWTGVVGGDGANALKVDGKLSEMHRKALIDDATSGGTEAAPIVFDEAVILTPVLHGELFPLVNVVPLTRGRRVEGFSIGNPTFTSGTAEGTAISLFSTTSMIQSFDTTVYNAVGAIEIGQDFEEDSPVNIGALVVQQYGEKAKEWLDNQIANGDGSTEPEGVLLPASAGPTDIGNPTGGAGAAAQLADYEALLFNVGKQYRNPADRNRCVFIANDTSYRRARAMSINAGSTEQRRVLGSAVNTHGSYEVLEHPFKVQNNIPNTSAGFFNMRYYRMYRRTGLNVRIETGGKELARKNLTLVVVRMRFGGRLELGGAGAYSDNWQA